MTNTYGPTIFALGGQVTPPVPEPAPTAKAGQLVVGELPGAPLSFQERPQLDDVVRVFAAGGQVAALCALTGANGVGKTQLAAAYARQQAAAGCPLVAWVSAETTDGLVAALDDVARAVGVADPEGDSTKSAVRLRSYLQAREEPALLVIDNAMDADQVRRFVPVTGATRVIVTSTDHALAQLGTPLDLSVFDRTQSLVYLRERTDLDDDPGADRVAEELGDLPLALAQAASVIQLQRISYADYLSRLRSMPVARVLPRRAGDPYPKGAAEAILLSVHAAEDTDESGLAQRLLALIALLSPNGAHRALVQQILHANDGDTDASVAARADEMLGRLAGLSLLVWGESGKSVIVHRLVARVIRERLQAAGALSATIVAIIKELSLLRIAEEQAWAQRERGAELVAHAIAVWENALNRVGDNLLTPEQIADCAQMTNWAVHHLTITADLSRAIRIGEQVLADCERVLGSDHPNTLASRHNLAYAYESVGRLTEAIPLFERTLADCERVRGADHPDTLTSRNSLAGAYRAAGRLTEAIPLYESTLADYERVRGADHPDTLTLRNSLACAYLAVGRLAEAIPLFESTLADRKRLVGADNSNTLATRNDLAGAYRAAGRLTDAIPLFESTLADCERVLGADHPHTLASRNDLAGAYRAAERLAEAIPLFESTLTDRKRLLGADHPNTLTTSNHLAGAYQAVGRLAEAFPLFESTLAACERVLGADHPNTLASRNDLAGAYRAAGQLTEAIKLYEATLADYARALSAHHPDTLITRNNLAGAYRAAGRMTEAIPLFENTLADCGRMLGANHPNTLTIRNNLAGAYLAVGRVAEAIPLFESTMVEREQLLGADHPDTLTSHINLAGAYRAAGRLAEAIRLYESTLADCERLLDGDHPTTRTVRDKLRRARAR